MESIHIEIYPETRKWRAQARGNSHRSEFIGVGVSSDRYHAATLAVLELGRIANRSLTKKENHER
jgi:hypothetical protein